MIHVYAADITSLPDPALCPALTEKLPRERQQKIQRCLHRKMRIQSFGAGLLLEIVLSEYGVQTNTVYRNEYGKPEAGGVCFNLSHSGELVVCAVSEKPVGCDVEKIRKAPKHIAGRFFCESEKKYLEAVKKGSYGKEFFRLWTMKESYMKMTGEGMNLPLNAFELVMGDENKVIRGGKVQPCFVKEYSIPGYQVTVCAEEQEFTDIIWKNLI